MRAAPGRSKTEYADLAANPELLDQGLVAAFIGPLEVIEQLATLRHEFQQAPPRVIVLNMGLEMLGEIGDALRKDRHLHLGRPGIARLFGMRPDDFRLAF